MSVTNGDEVVFGSVLAFTSVIVPCDTEGVTETIGGRLITEATGVGTVITVVDPLGNTTEPL